MKLAQVRQVVPWQVQEDGIKMTAPTPSLSQTTSRALSAKLAADSGAGRGRHVAELASREYADVHENILEALAEDELANRLTPDEERADLIAAVAEADADVEAGRTTPLADELTRWETMKAELLTRGRE